MVTGGMMGERFDGRLRAVSPFAWPGLLSRISEIDEFKGWWLGRFRTAPATLGRLVKKVVVQSANSSIRVEWSGLPRHPSGSRPAPPPSTPGETRTSPAAAYAQLLKEVFDGYRGMPLSAELVLRLHANLMGHSSKGAAQGGAWRAGPDRSLLLPLRAAESITLRPSEPEKIPSEMEALIRWANARLGSREFHPLMVTAGFLLEFLAIRPFAEGNGRMSRLLTNLLLLRRGYAYMPYASLEKAVEERKAEYYLALRKSQSSMCLQRPDMTPWLTAFLDALRAQARELRTFLEGTPPESRLSGNQVAVMRLFEHHREVTNRLVAGEINLSRETSKQVLNRLVALNLLERIGAGRATRYRRVD
jgi:Fic family protein